MKRPVRIQNSRRLGALAATMILWVSSCGSVSSVSGDGAAGAGGRTGATGGGGAAGTPQFAIQNDPDCNLSTCALGGTTCISNRPTCNIGLGTCAGTTCCMGCVNGDGKCVEGSGAGDCGGGGYDCHVCTGSNFPYCVASPADAGSSVNPRVCSSSPQ